RQTLSVKAHPRRGCPACAEGGRPDVAPRCTRHGPGPPEAHPGRVRDSHALSLLVDLGSWAIPRTAGIAKEGMMRRAIVGAALAAMTVGLMGGPALAGE